MMEHTSNSRRSAGTSAGSFEGIRAKGDWPQAAPGRPFVTLSRYHPRAEELPAVLEGSAVHYQLASVAGYLHSPGTPSQRRRRLWLVSEGSVLSAPPGAVMADVTDIGPVVGSFPHPVWHYGLALLVPMEVPHA